MEIVWELKLLLWILIERVSGPMVGDKVSTSIKCTWITYSLRLEIEKRLPPDVHSFQPFCRLRSRIVDPGTATTCSTTAAKYSPAFTCYSNCRCSELPLKFGATSACWTPNGFQSRVRLFDCPTYLSPVCPLAYFSPVLWVCVHPYRFFGSAIPRSALFLSCSALGVWCYDDMACKYWDVAVT